MTHTHRWCHNWISLKHTLLAHSSRFTNKRRTIKSTLSSHYKENPQRKGTWGKGRTLKHTEAEIYMNVEDTHWCKLFPAKELCHYVTNIYTKVRTHRHTHTHMYTYHELMSKLPPTKQDPSEPSLQLQARGRDGGREGINTPPTSYSAHHYLHCFRSEGSSYVSMGFSLQWSTARLQVFHWCRI